MYQDHEFDPVTPELEAQREQEKELARRIRREVRRMDSGEADEELQADQEQEATEKAEREEAEQKDTKRKGSLIFQFFSGTILVRKGVSQYYPYMICIAGMFFLSIAVMFWSLHLDMKYSRLERGVQMLRERSIRLQEQRYRRTTHSAILLELQKRGLELCDPATPSETIDN